MRISMIVAMSENRVIGKENKLPWHLPEELKHFRKTTLGKPIIMGRKTFESMGSKPLPNRLNIILTHDTQFKIPPHVDANACVVARSLEQALSYAAGHEEVMVIGGGKIYEQFLPKATRIYLTTVHQYVDGDVFFPILDNTEWEERSKTDNEQFTIQVLERTHP